MEITNLIAKGLQLGVGFSMIIGSMATLSLIPGVGGIFGSIGTALSGLYSSPIIGGLLATFGSIGGILLVLYIGLGYDPLGFGRFNLGHIFGFVTALAGGFILINSWSLLRDAKTTLEDVIPGGEIIGVIEETVTA